MGHHRSKRRTIHALLRASALSWLITLGMLAACAAGAHSVVSDRARFACGLSGGVAWCAWRLQPGTKGTWGTAGAVEAARLLVTDADIDASYRAGKVTLVRYWPRPTWHTFLATTFVTIPLPSVLALLTLAAPLLWWAVRRRKRGFCVECDYDLTGNQSGICPECGEPIAELLPRSAP